MRIKARWIGLLLACGPVACGGGSPDDVTSGVKSGEQALQGTGNSGFGFPVWRHSDGRWYEWNGFNGQTSTDPWGTAGDIPVRMNAAGRANNDEVVFRPSEGNWYVRYMDDNLVNQTIVKHWGTMGDIPVPGDYDNDGFDDYAVFRPGNGMWYVSCRSTLGFCASAGTKWGTPGDVPVPGDYDGDGKNDLAIFRPSTNQWFVLHSSNGTAQNPTWGTAGDAVAQSDFDGDGKTDMAMFRPSNGNWYIRPSNGAAAYTVNWGIAGDIVTPLDFDGDGKADIAVWRPSNGRWYYRESSSSNVIEVANGQAGDVPIGYTSVTMASPEPPPPGPGPGPNPPPPPPPLPVPTQGSIQARFYLDTSNTAIGCGMAPFWYTKNAGQTGAPVGEVVWDSGEFVGIAEGKKPGLKRCRYDGSFPRVQPGSGYFVCGKAGVSFCVGNVTVVAGQTVNLTLAQ